MVICGSPSPIWLDLVGADWEFTELKLWKTFDFAPVPASPDLTHRERNAEPALNNSTSIC
jgi:hypothetical protein